MKKNIFWLFTLLMTFAGLTTSCSSDDDIVFDHELPMFEIQADKILLEVILPNGTTADDEVYISGAFNGGDDVAVGNPDWALLRTDKSSIKRGVYLDPSRFVNGKTLADGYHFVSASRRNEVSSRNDSIVRTATFNVGTRTNVFVDQWAAFFDKADDNVEIEHDGFAVFVDDQTGWGKLYMYQWGDINDLGGGWPGALPAGTQTIDGVKYAYFDFGAVNTGLVQNLIFNNGEGTQLNDFNFTIDRDLYLRLTPDGIEEIGPSVSHDGYVVYVDDQTGWEDLCLYQWGDVNDLGGGWPGARPTGVEMVNGVEYKYFDMGAGNEGLNQNLIFSNAGANQLTDFAFTVSRNVYLRITTSGVTEIDPNGAVSLPALRSK